MPSAYPPSRRTRPSVDLGDLKRRLAKKPRPTPAPAFDEASVQRIVSEATGQAISQGMREIDAALSGKGAPRGFVIGGSGDGRSMIVSGNGNIQVGGSYHGPRADDCRDPMCEVAGCRGKVDHADFELDVHTRTTVTVEPPPQTQRSLGFWGFLGAAMLCVAVAGLAPWWVTVGAGVAVAVVLRHDWMKLAELETRRAEALAINAKDQQAQRQLAAADPNLAAELDHSHQPSSVVDDATADHCHACNQSRRGMGPDPLYTH